jgi:hypothetical protein
MIPGRAAFQGILRRVLWVPTLEFDTGVGELRVTFRCPLLLRS